MRIGGFLITQEEGRRWAAEKYPNLFTDDYRAVSVLRHAVKAGGARYVVASYPTEKEDDWVHFIPTRQAPFSARLFRDIGSDARQLELFKWDDAEAKILNLEDKVQKLTKEQGVKAEFTTIYIEDSRWKRMLS